MEPPNSYGQQNGSFLAAGEEAGIRKLVEDFYFYMDVLPEAEDVREMHPKDLAEAKDKLARFLCGWMGGPNLYQDKYGSIHIPQAHAHLKIGRKEKASWLFCMKMALNRQDYPQSFKDYLMKQFEIPAERVRNTD